MYRRRRPNREKIAFSFDSFLDVVANVIGIIIKLILVVWVGARSYTAMMALVEQEPIPSPPSTRPAPKLTDDPLHADVQRTLNELEEARTRLTAQLRQLGSLDEKVNATESAIVELRGKRTETQSQLQAMESLLQDEKQRAHLAHLSLDELRQRGQKLLEQIKEIERLPTQKKTLRYHTPVSQTVRGDELFFECRAGKITYIDIEAFLHEIAASNATVADELRTRNRVEGATSQVGAFRLRYIFEKEVTGGGGFRYGLGGWVLEPLSSNRGETLEAALAAGSEFRRIADILDPNQTVVTFWVYPDSFELFRRLRDYLYERDIEVAGRPLPTGAPIAAARNGTKSRGQ